MDDGDGSKDGGTGQPGPKPSLDATACQTPTQPGVPAWMLARNNSVHAPVFGQPSEQKSPKLPSTSSFAFGSGGSKSPWAEVRAAIRANNTNGQANAPRPSTQPSPSVDLGTLSDDQALALLLENETVAGLLQNAFNTRVEEHQQKVQRAYTQRLLELEEYTRSWRDTTKELWLAVSEGKFNTNHDQRESLSWKGPQEAGHDFNPECPTVSREIVEKEFDSDGRVACISVKNSSALHSDSHFNLVNWTNSNGCGSRNFKTFAHKLGSYFNKLPRLVFRHKTKSGRIEYRSITSVDSTTQNINRGDACIELTPSNVALLGKAFCYLKDTHDRYHLRNSHNFCKDISEAELAFLRDRFSRQPTKRHIDVLALYAGKKVIPDLFAVNINVAVIPKRLLIARPRYNLNDNGGISGVKFFDVGRDAYTTRQEGDEIILFEDRVVFARLALLLGFSVDAGIVPVSETLAPPKPSLFQRTLALSDGLKELRDESRHDQSNPQAHIQWLAIGGEPQDVRSPSPKLEQDRIMDNRSQAYGVEEEVLPFELTNQHTIDDLPDGSQDSDLVMLDEQPKNVTFRCRKKRPPPAAGQVAKTTKKPKFSTVEPSTVLETQLPLSDPHGQALQGLPNLPLGSLARTEGLDKERLGEPAAGSSQSQADTEQKKPHTTSSSQAQSIPLGEQHPVATFSPLPPPSEVIAGKTHGLGEQLRQLGCRFEDNVDQVDGSTAGGNIENSEQLQAIEAFKRPPAPGEMTASHELREQLRQLGCRFEDDIDKVDVSTIGDGVRKIEQLQTRIERLEGMLETQRRIEDRQKADENLGPGAHLPSFGVPNQTKVSLGDSDSPFTEQECATDTQKVLTGQSESAPAAGENLCSSINDSTALAAPAGPERSPPTIPTEPKAFRGVPEEPRAMSTAAPQTCSPYFACAVSIAPVSQDQSLQAKVSLSTAEEPKETKDEDIESLIREQELEQRLDEIQNAREKERVAAAPRDSPTTPNQVNEARGMNHSDSTALQNHQPSHAAVISSPPPSHHDNPAEPANPNPFATVGRPVVSIGPLDHETQLVPEFPQSAHSSSDEGEAE